MKHNPTNKKEVAHMLNRTQTARLLGYSTAGFSLIYNGYRKPSWAACERMKKYTLRTYEWFMSASTAEVQKVFDRVSRREAA